MNDFGMEFYAGGNCFNRVISRILLFYYGEVIRRPFIYFYFYFRGRIYIRERRNSIQQMSLAKVILCDFSLSIQIEWEFPRYGQQEKAEPLILSFYFTLLGNGKVLRRFLDTHAALPLLAWAANLHFPGFPNSERRKAGNCSFTAALIGGKPAFPGFLRSERRKSGKCSLTAALIGGKAAFPGFLRSERTKSGIFRLTAVVIGGKPAFSSFPPV